MNCIVVIVVEGFGCKRRSEWAGFESRSNGEQWGDDRVLPILKYVSTVIPTVCRKPMGNKPSAETENGRTGGCLVRERKESQKGRLKELDAIHPSSFG